jgi:thiamine biosynthesis protein ThiS
MLLNNRQFEHYVENMTIQDVIDVMRFTYPRLVIKVNGQLIQKKEYSNFFLNENDDVKIHHLLAGG